MCLAVFFTDLSIAVGLVGAGIGAYIGLQFLAYDRNLPLVGAIGFFALFAWLAHLILLLVWLAIGIGLIVVVIWYRDAISRWIEIFAEAAGVRLNFSPLETFADRIGDLTDQFLARNKLINSLPLERQDIDDILGNAKDAYIDAINGLSDEFPYGNGKQQNRTRAEPRSGDDDEFGAWLNGQ